MTNLTIILFSIAMVIGGFVLIVSTAYGSCRNGGYNKHLIGVAIFGIVLAICGAILPVLKPGDKFKELSIFRDKKTIIAETDETFYTYHIQETEHEAQGGWA